MKPIELIWDDVAYDYFERHITSHHGEVLKAIGLIGECLRALNKGDRILYLRNGKNKVISDLPAFKELVLRELSEDADYLLDCAESFMNDRDIVEPLSDVRKQVTQRKFLTQKEALDIAQAYIDSKGLNAELTGKAQWLSEWTDYSFLHEVNHPVWVVFANNLSARMEGTYEYNFAISILTKKVEDVRMM